jgi:hypothetical protein
MVQVLGDCLSKRNCLPIGNILNWGESSENMFALNKDIIPTQRSGLLRLYALSGRECSQKKNIFPCRTHGSRFHQGICTNIRKIYRLIKMIAG